MPGEVRKNVAHVSPIAPQVRRYGWLAAIGLSTFLASLVLLHLGSPGISWTNDYVSNLANEPHGWLFGFGTFVHGWGNLALALGLRRTLRPGRLRTWGVLLFVLAALGVLLTALFPIDPAGQLVTTSGRIHRAVASGAFVFELAALFVFSLVFALSRCHHWQKRKSASLLMAVIAALAVSWFVIANQIGVMPGLAERAALLAFMYWEIWVIAQLVRWQAGSKGCNPTC